MGSRHFRATLRPDLRQFCMALDTLRSRQPKGGMLRVLSEGFFSRLGALGLPYNRNVPDVGLRRWGQNPWGYPKPEEIPSRWEDTRPKLVQL